MPVHRHGADSYSEHSRKPGKAAVGRAPVGGRVHVTCEVVEPLLRRADLLSQLLRIGMVGEPQE
jgi:hypothetical protein